jgi:hypothetical protein
MRRQLHAVVARDEPERLEEDPESVDDVLPEVFSEAEQEWLTGFEYEPIRGDRHDFDFGVGVRLSSPVDPYVRLRYRLQEPIAKRWLLRFRVSPFWRESTQLGVGSRIDFDHPLHDRLFLRLGATATLSELSHEVESQGVEWRAGPVLYHRLGESRAIAYRLTFERTLDSSEASTLHRLETVHRLDVLLRQRLHREWLILEVGPRVESRHPSPEEQRELIPGLGLGLELRFGDR